MRAKPWELPDGLWERIEPLLPRAPRRFRYPGRKPLDDRRMLQGILFVLHTGVGWEGGFKWSLQHLDQEVAHGTSEGLGSGGDRAGADALARASAGVAS